MISVPCYVMPVGKTRGDDYWSKIQKFCTWRMCCIGKLSYQQNPSVYVYYFKYGTTRLPKLLKTKASIMPRRTTACTTNELPARISKRHLRARTCQYSCGHGWNESRKNALKLSFRKAKIHVIIRKQSKNYLSQKVYEDFLNIFYKSKRTTFHDAPIPSTPF